MRNQKIVIVIGSPRKEGNSATLAQQVTAGAQAHGADVECFHLHDMNIHPCDACDLCRESTEAECVIEDAMQDLYPRLRSADADVQHVVAAGIRICVVDIDRFDNLTQHRGFAGFYPSVRSTGSVSSSSRILRS